MIFPIATLLGCVQEIFAGNIKERIELVHALHKNRALCNLPKITQVRPDSIRKLWKHTEPSQETMLMCCHSDDEPVIKSLTVCCVMMHAADTDNMGGVRSDFPD